MGRNQEKLAINKQTLARNPSKLYFEYVEADVSFQHKRTKIPTKILPLEKTKVFSFIKSDKLHVKSQSYAWQVVCPIV